MQVSEYFKYAAEKLEKIYPAEEAKQIMYWVFEDVLLIKKKHLYLFDKEIGFAEELKLEPVLNRLLSGEPLQYILGYAYFRNLHLKVSKDVLIPRPETEELVDWVISDVNAIYGGAVVRILDIGTGSGCIALSIKKEVKNAKVYALDVSAEALDIAQFNASQNKLSIHFKQASILDEKGKAWVHEQNFDLLVSNPPYITDAEKSGMHANVLSFEPAMALFVPDADPLVFYRNILETFIECASARLLFFEISEFQETALAELLKKNALDYTFKTDLQGKSRMLRVTKL